MNSNLEDSRDRTIFVEYYSTYILTSVWANNGRLYDYHVASYA